MQVKIIKTGRVLAPTQINIADYVINPYRGCEFGCVYCYGKTNKNTKEGYLGVKDNIKDILERELKYLKPKRVLLGSVTECFQYAEAKFKLTEKILRLLNSYKIPYTILTKSALIRNYLKIIAENKENEIYFTLNFSSQKIIDVFEDKSSDLSSRLNSIKEIIRYKIPLQIHIGPFIPYVSCLKDIIPILPSGVKIINVELYHYKQGSFEDILGKTATALGKETEDKLSSVYRNKNNYLSYARCLEGKIKEIKKKTPFSFCYIVPDYNSFYGEGINYNRFLE